MSTPRSIRDNHTQTSHIAGDLCMNTSPWNKDRIIGHKKTTSDIPYLGEPNPA